MTITPESDFLNSFDALERSLRALPYIDGVLPDPVAPDASVLDEWLRPYRSWSLPSTYVAFCERYGGVSVAIPAEGVGIRPLTELLVYRREQDASGEVFATREIVLSDGNMEGDLRLVFSEDNEEPRVAFMNADDDIEYEGDSFSAYLWSSVFFFAAVYKAPHHEFTSVMGISSDDMDDYHLRLAPALRAGGFDVLAADRRLISGQRADTRFSTSVRGPTQVGVSIGRDADYHAMMQDHADIITIMESTR